MAEVGKDEPHTPKGDGRGKKNASKDDKVRSHSSPNMSSKLGMLHGFVPQIF
jgi:hypothetical protein